MLAKLLGEEVGDAEDPLLPPPPSSPSQAPWFGVPQLENGFVFVFIILIEKQIYLYYPFSSYFFFSLNLSQNKQTEPFVLILEYGQNIIITHNNNQVIFLCVIENLKQLLTFVGEEKCCILKIFTQKMNFGPYMMKVREGERGEREEKRKGRLLLSYFLFLLFFFRKI